MPSRKEKEEYVYKLIDEVDTSGYSTSQYKEMFSKMNKFEFETWCNKIKEGKFKLTVLAPLDSKGITLSNNKKVLKKRGVDIFKQMKISTNDGVFVPPFKFNVMRLPTRRTTHHISKGLAVAKHNRQRNSITGQVTRDSRAASITLPEANILMGIGLIETLDEIMSMRGGDRNAIAALVAHAINTGQVSKSDIAAFRSRAESTDTLKAIFKAMHIDIGI